MTKEYRIETVADFLQLSPDQRQRCAADLVAWAGFIDDIRNAMPGVFNELPEMVWVDDDRTGEISAVVLCDKDGVELSRTEFPKVPE